MPVTPPSTGLILTPEQLVTQAQDLVITRMAGIESNLGKTILNSRIAGASTIYGAPLDKPKAAATFLAYTDYGPALVLSDVLQRFLQSVQKVEPGASTMMEVLGELLKPFAAPNPDGSQPLVNDQPSSPAGSLVPDTVILKVWKGETEVDLGAVVQAIALAIQPLIDADRVTIE